MGTPGRHLGPAPSILRRPKWRAARLLRYRLEQRPGPHSVLLSNDGSTDRTHDVLQKLLADLQADGSPGSPSVHYRRVANGGKARALNTALAIARGEIVVTIDADSVMERDFIDRIVRP